MPSFLDPYIASDLLLIESDLTTVVLFFFSFSLIYAGILSVLFLEVECKSYLK